MTKMTQNNSGLFTPKGTVPLGELGAKLSELASEGTLCVITGLTGSGVSYVVRRTRTNPNVWLIVEDFLDVRNEEDRVQYNSYPPADVKSTAKIVAGKSSNLFSIVGEILGAQEFKGLALFYVMPDHRVITGCNAVKLATIREESATNTWKVLSKLSPSGLRRKLKSNEALHASHLSRLAERAGVSFVLYEVANVFDKDQAIDCNDETLESSTPNQTQKK